MPLSRVALVGLAGLLLLAAPAAAQNYAAGTVVGRGDYDYVPVAVAVAASAPCALDLDGDGAYDAFEPLLLDINSAACAMSQANDVRLSTNGNLAAGSVLKAGDADHNRPVIGPVNDDLLWFDANGDTEFGSTDTLYLDLLGAGTLRADVGDLRLTRYNDNLTAGSFVKAGDPDAAQGLRELTTPRDLQDANIVYLTGGSAPFKSGRSLYLNIDGGAVGTADLSVEANDVRLTATFLQPFGGRADIRPFNVGFTPNEPVAGQPFQFSVEVRNEGKGTGAALVTTRMANNTVDARSTPSLDPNARATLVVTLVAPATPGPAMVEVGDVRLQMNVVAPPPAANAALAALEQRVAALEQRLQAAQAELGNAQTQLTAAQGQLAALETLKAQAAEPGPEPQLQATEAQLGDNATPGPGALAVLGLLAALALVAARRLK